MNEAKTALKRLAVYYLLLALNVVFCANVIPDVFPARNLSTVYLLALSASLVLYYSHRVTPSGGLSSMMKRLSRMCLLLILLRGIKYSAFSGVGVLARHVWYLYYVPVLLLPLFLFGISLLVSHGENARVPRIWYPALALTAAFIVLVLTNDLHQQVFAFNPDFLNWDGDYSRGWLFYLLTAWEYALYFGGITVLVVKCRISGAKRNAWIILIPLALGIAAFSLLAADKMPRINETPIVEFPEAFIFTAAAVLECCMQLGLVPTNTDYGGLFRELSISALITDKNGEAVYSSRSAVPLAPEQFALPGGSRTDAHTVLQKIKLPGGYGFWRDDMTELDRLNDELAEAKEGLAQEAELIRLRNELKEKQTEIEQRTLVYDAIAKRTQRQSQEISRLAQSARAETDVRAKEEYGRRITLLGAYIKRYANLTLLSQENSFIEAGELGLSVSEVLRCLNGCGIPGECICGAECAVPSGTAPAVFEAFGTLLEDNYTALRGVFVNLTEKEDLLFKITLENLQTPLAEEPSRRLAEAGVLCDYQTEDGIAYYCFTVPKGGAVK